MLYSYRTHSGKVAVSPHDLGYAANSDGSLDLAKVTAEDNETLSLFADKYMAYLFTLLSDSKRWEAMDTAPDAALDQWRGKSYHRNCTVIADGTVMIHDGHFRTLDEYLHTADKGALRFALEQTAIQAALAHAEMVRASAVRCDFLETARANV